jgi:protein SCO1/2
VTNARARIPSNAGPRWGRVVACSALAFSLNAGAARDGAAQTIVEDGVVTRKEPLPERVRNVDVDEHLDRALPLGLQFRSTNGEQVALSRYVRGDRPVIFTLNYADCPMLCSLQLSGLVKVLGKLDRKLGTDFEIVTVSLNPSEASERTRETEARYRGDLSGTPGAGAWHFLTGTKGSIDALAEALGIRYAYNEKRKEYLHPAVMVISTPRGHISRYLYGIEYKPQTVSLSLVEAAEGKVGSSVDRLILYCFHYDETEGRYAPVAMNIMRAGGAATALGLGAFLGAYWLGVWRRRMRDARTSAGPSHFGPVPSPLEDSGS